jgi:hypothetical protein
MPPREMAGCHRPSTTQTTKDNINRRINLSARVSL